MLLMHVLDRVVQVLCALVKAIEPLRGRLQGLREHLIWIRLELGIEDLERRKSLRERYIVGLI